MNKNIFALKDRLSYPKILNDEMKLVSFNKNNSSLIGSMSYKIQKYPSDIDLYEQIKVCCSKEEAIEYFQLGIKRIVNEVRLKRYHWVIEIKCGIDDRYDVINNLTQSNLNNFLNDNLNILDMKDYNELNNLSVHSDLEKITDILRKYYIIRWTADEVEFGQKVKAGKRFYFEDCIDTISPINIEIIAVVNRKFTDISNFYVLMFHNKIDGTDVLINFPQDYLVDGRLFVIEGLKDGINKVLFSKIHKDVFKGIKRMYSLARITQDEKLYDKIKDIVSSDLSALSQIKSEFATINEILNFTDELPWNILFSQLDGLKFRLGGNTFLPDNYVVIFSDAIDTILSNKRDIEYMKEKTLEIKNSLLEIINVISEEYLKEKKLYIKF